MKQKQHTISWRVSPKVAINSTLGLSYKIVIVVLHNIFSEPATIQLSNHQQTNSSIEQSNTTMEMTMEKDDSDKKVVRFSEMSTMVTIPHSGRSWYSYAENSLFRELFARSVDDLRIRVSRGEVGCEIVGLEKHLTRDVSNHQHYQLEFSLCCIIMRSYSPFYYLNTAIKRVP